MISLYSLDHDYQRFLRVLRLKQDLKRFRLEKDSHFVTFGIPQGYKKRGTGDRLKKLALLPSVIVSINKITKKLYEKQKFEV